MAASPPAGPSWRIFGAELSPYSVKVRSYFRYKGIPHQWLERSAANVEEFRRHARLPLIPLVLAPDGSALQDSTPILEALEQRFPQPSIQPADPALAFLSALIEEYADEWGNKPMFHYRASLRRCVAILDFDRWVALAPTLEPLLRDEVAGLFLPWSDANARALAAGEPRFSLELEGEPFGQDTQKYHARSLAVLRARYAACGSRGELDPILERTGCLRWLGAP